jgi:CheY-like chemotaxis protein
VPLPATVLVVEDEQGQMALLTQVFTSGGCHVVPAYGGEGAIRKVKGGRIHLVVTDLAMRKVTGIEVVHRRDGTSVGPGRSGSNPSRLRRFPQQALYGHYD